MSNDSLKLPKGVSRSPTWRSFEKRYFQKHGKRCIVCGSNKKVELHHILPFHVYPDKEEDELNVIPLCESGNGGANHHLFIGHAGDFRGWNPDVKKDAKAWAKKMIRSKMLAKTAKKL